MATEHTVRRESGNVTSLRRFFCAQEKIANSIYLERYRRLN